MPSLLPYPASALTSAHFASSSSAIIDIEHTFWTATHRYILLDQATSLLISDMAALSPQKILSRCKQLAEMQQQLASQDDQLVTILALAGPEIVNNSFIKDYHDILIKVSQTFDLIWHQTSLVKKKLTERLDNTGKA